MSTSNTNNPYSNRLTEEIQQSRQWLLYLITWRGENLDPKYIRKNILQDLLIEKLVVPKGTGYEATDVGRKLLSVKAQTALTRPQNFDDLPPAEQWAIDDRLGLLDWDGT